MTQHIAQREEGVGGRARVRLGLVGREGTIDCDTDDGRPRTHTATHTLHNTHQEPQWATLTSPSSTTRWEVRGRSPADSTNTITPSRN
jgi:hypothetical protein